MKKQHLTIIWEGIAIDVVYIPEYSPGFTKTYGWRMAHLCIKRQDKGQLPMTETGYKSHFTNAANIEEIGGTESYVRALLDEYGSSKKWKEYAAKERQMTLF
ncbi:MAG: hypothetical protein AAFZ15_24875 [Bacteroidota bacterium]